MTISIATNLEGRFTGRRHGQQSSSDGRLSRPVSDGGSGCNGRVALSTRRTASTWSIAWNRQPSSLRTGPARDATSTPRSQDVGHDVVSSSRQSCRDHDMAGRPFDCGEGTHEHDLPSQATEGGCPFEGSFRRDRLASPPRTSRHGSGHGMRSFVAIAVGALILGVPASGALSQIGKPDWPPGAECKSNTT